MAYRPPPVTKFGWRQAGAVAGAIIAALATLLPSTTVNVAIPDIQGALGIDDIRAQWLSSSFLAATTLGMLANARIVGRFGIRATMTACLILFTLSSIMGGLAINLETAVLARILQGLAAGPIMPISMMVMLTSFPPHQHGQAMGWFGMGVVLAPGIGPTLGGWLIQEISWRYVFFGMAPLSLLALPLVLNFLSSETDPDEINRKNFDWTGLLLMTLWLVATMAFISRGPREGWADTTTQVLIATSILLLLVFIIWEWLHKEPLMDVKLFRTLPFAAGSAVALFTGVALYTTSYLTPLFVQKLQGLTPMQSGWLLMPSGIAMSLAFPIIGYISDRWYMRDLMIIGIVILCISQIPFIWINPNTAAIYIIIYTLIGRIGLSMVMPGTGTLTISSLPPEYLPQGASITNFLRQIGGVIGIGATSISLHHSSVANGEYLGASLSKQPALQDYVLGIEQSLQPAGISNPIANEIALERAAIEASMQAQVLGFQSSFTLMVILLCLALIPAVFTLRNPPPVPKPDTDSTPQAGGAKDTTDP